MGNATGMGFADVIKKNFNVRRQALAVVNAGWPALTVPKAVRTVVINTFIDGVDDTVSDDGRSQRSTRCLVEPRWWIVIAGGRDHVKNSSYLNVFFGWCSLMRFTPRAC